MRVGPLAALDADELFAQVVGQRADFAVADDKAAILVLYLADGGDHCRRAAGEALGKSAAARVFRHWAKEYSSSSLSTRARGPVREWSCGSRPAGWYRRAAG